MCEGKKSAVGRGQEVLERQRTNSAGGENGLKSLVIPSNKIATCFVCFEVIAQIRQEQWAGVG